MKNNTRKIFIKHLYKVCKDKLLRKYAYEYFLDITKYFENVRFSKQDFESIIIDGEEINQDIVIGLLSNVESITIEEVVTYLFVNNISSIEYFSEDESDERLGQYNQIIKKVQISRKCLESYEILKHTLYHELSHVFTKKTYVNGKIINSSMVSSSFIVDENNYYVYVSNDKVHKELLNKMFKREKDKILITNVDYIDNLKSTGEYELYEIFNEELACLIEGSLLFTNNSLDLTNNSYNQKSELVSPCVYRENYFAVVLLKLVLENSNEKNLYFNSNQIFKNLESLKIDEKILDELVADLTFLILRQLDLDTKNEALFNSSYNYLKNMDIYSLVSICIGAGKMTNNINISKNDYTIITESLIIETFKQKILNDLVDESRAKDKNYFLDLNDSLLAIDGFLNYPIFKRNINENLESLPISVWAKDMPKFQHLVSFNSLIDLINSIVEKYRSKVENIDGIMTFLAEQRKLEREYLRKNNSNNMLARIGKSKSKNIRTRNIQLYENGEEKGTENV